MPEDPPGYLIAFDFGLKSIGTAIGQTITGTAGSLRTVRAHNGKPEWVEIEALVSEWRPVRLLVGLPLNMDDTESDMSERARQFADALAERFALPVTMVDERLSSREAKERTGGDIQAAHNVAAVLIAESYLR